jgi:tRNA1(Val) A37 N6-methylase TrmN6
MRINISLSEENAQRFKTLGASKWLNRLLAASGSVYVLTEAERMSIIEAVSGSKLTPKERQEILNKLIKTSY